MSETIQQNVVFKNTLSLSSFHISDFIQILIKWNTLRVLSINRDLNDGFCWDSGTEAAGHSEVTFRRLVLFYHESLTVKVNGPGNVRQRIISQSDTSRFKHYTHSLSPALHPPPPHLRQWRHTGGELMEASTNKTSRRAGDVIGWESGAARGQRRRKETAPVAMQVYYGEEIHTHTHTLSTNTHIHFTHTRIHTEHKHTHIHAYTHTHTLSIFLFECLIFIGILFLYSNFLFLFCLLFSSLVRKRYYDRAET